MSETAETADRVVLGENDSTADVVDLDVMKSISADDVDHGRLNETETPEVDAKEELIMQMKKEENGVEHDGEVLEELMKKPEMNIDETDQVKTDEGIGNEVASVYEDNSLTNKCQIQGDVHDVCRNASKTTMRLNSISSLGAFSSSSNIFDSVSNYSSNYDFSQISDASEEEQSVKLSRTVSEDVVDSATEQTIENKTKPEGNIIDPIEVRDIKIQPNIDEKLLPKLDEKLLPKLDENVEPNLDENLQPSLNKNVEPNLDESLQPSLDEKYAPTKIKTSELKAVIVVESGDTGDVKVEDDASDDLGAEKVKSMNEFIGDKNDAKTDGELLTPKLETDFEMTNARVHGPAEDEIKKTGIRVLQPPGGFSSGLW